MADPKIIEEWLSKAAEKYLKTLIIAYDLEFEKIHNLVNLVKTCSKKEPSLSSILNECIFLNAFYIDTRYPVHWPTDYSKERALKAKEYSQKVATAIKLLLKEKGFLGPLHPQSIEDTEQ